MLMFSVETSHVFRQQSKQSLIQALVKQNSSAKARVEKHKLEVNFELAGHLLGWSIIIRNFVRYNAACFIIVLELILNMFELHDILYCVVTISSLLNCGREAFPVVTIKLCVAVFFVVDYCGTQGVLHVQ